MNNYFRKKNWILFEEFILKISYKIWLAWESNSPLFGGVFGLSFRPGLARQLN